MISFRTKYRIKYWVWWKEVKTYRSGLLIGHRKRINLCSRSKISWDRIYGWDDDIENLMILKIYIMTLESRILSLWFLHLAPVFLNLQKFLKRTDHTLHWTWMCHSLDIRKSLLILSMSSVSTRLNNLVQWSYQKSHWCDLPVILTMLEL